MLLSNKYSGDASPSFSPALLQSFSLQAVTESEVLKEPLKLDPKSDSLDPFIFEVAAPIIAKPISNLLTCLSFLGWFPLLARFVLYLKGR
jgi:hypothetical protein